MIVFVSQLANYFKNGQFYSLPLNFLSNNNNLKFYIRFDEEQQFPIFTI